MSVGWWLVDSFLIWHTYCVRFDIYDRGWWVQTLGKVSVGSWRWTQSSILLVRQVSLPVLTGPSPHLTHYSSNTWLHQAHDEPLSVENTISGHHTPLTPTRAAHRGKLWLEKKSKSTKGSAQSTGRFKNMCYEDLKEGNWMLTRELDPNLNSLPNLFLYCIISF